MSPLKILCLAAFLILAVGYVLCCLKTAAAHTKGWKLISRMYADIKAPEHVEAHLETYLHDKQATRSQVYWTLALGSLALLALLGFLLVA